MMREIQLTDAQYQHVVKILNSPVEAKPGTKDICEVAAPWDVKSSAPRRVWFDDGTLWCDLDDARKTFLTFGQ